METDISTPAPKQREADKEGAGLRAAPPGCQPPSPTATSVGHCRWLGHTWEQRWQQRGDLLPGLWAALSKTRRSTTSPFFKVSQERVSKEDTATQLCLIAVMYFLILSLNLAVSISLPYDTIRETLS